jgi:PAS domain S-box-containing protein
VEKTKEELKKLSEGYTTVDFINRYLTNSNTYRLLQWVANPDPVSGELFAIARDNTYLKKIKTKIEESATTIEQLNSALNESAIVSVTDSNGIIEFVNDAFCKISKFNREELIGKHTRIIDSGFYTDTFTDRIKEKIEKGQVWKGEIKNKSKDGSFFWVETTIVPFQGIDKKPVRYITICHDVTERVKLENALRKSKDQIEKSAQIKEQFLANMSHEIRTPLNAIIGFSEILQASKLTPVQEEHAKIISQSGECLMGIINDILDYSKTESGNITLEKIPINLKEMLDNVQKMFQKAANEKKIDLKVYLGNHIPLCVIGDPIRTNQVLVNLVGNAIKFTNKGSVNIFCNVKPKSDDTYLIEFKIQDTGIGIPTEKLELIFDRFVQAENDTSRKFGGTGLGLSIVKNLVTLMGGEIFVESKLGRESQFTVIIPAGKCTDEQIDEYKNNKIKTSLPKQSKNITLNILLVEDNRMNQQYVQTLLEQLGFDCTLAVNGIEAINKIKENKFDIILMDIQMPQMDGYEATRIIRNELKNNTPIIALTANATSFEYDKCLQNGMNGFLSKPYKPKDLLEKINEVKNNAPSNKNGIDELKSNQSLMEQEGLINFDSIKEQVNGKINAVKQLIKIFMEDTPRDIEALEDAILHEDYNATEAISHQLVSSYSIFGISSAIRILKEMEIKAGNQKEIDVIKFLYRQLVEINEKAKTQINNSSFI